MYQQSHSAVTPSLDAKTAELISIHLSSGLMEVKDGPVLSVVISTKLKTTITRPSMRKAIDMTMTIELSSVLEQSTLLQTTST
jgi:ATP-dependent Lon protease